MTSVSWGSAARWTAVAIAMTAILDPRMPLPRRERPAIRVLGAGGPAESVTRQLRDAGFAVDDPDGEVAQVLVGNHAPPGTEHRALSTEHLPVWAVDTSPRAPNVEIVDATGPAMRLPGQAVEVRVTLEARGLAGRTSTLVLEDAGIVVSSTSHVWKKEEERWQASLQYLAPGIEAARLRVRAIEVAGEAAADDNTADVAIPSMRGPLRTLVVEAGVTWPAMFVRRAIEGEPGFAVAAVQHASSRVATRGGGPPEALTRDALAAFEVALIGAPDNLTAGDLEALRWFVEERGGVAVLVPDRRPVPPGGRYLDLIGSPAIEPRALETPVSLDGGLVASELLLLRSPLPGPRLLAATAAGEAVVLSVRRGTGSVIFSGALDAWRARARDDEAFARFWMRAIAEEAAAVPPVLEVSVTPAIVAPGEATRVRARLRQTELPGAAESFDLDAVTAHATSPGARIDSAVRLWPTAEPGLYEGEWRPPVSGEYAVTVTMGSRRGDATLRAAAAVTRGSGADAQGLASIARVSGGQVFAADQAAAFVDAMKGAFPARVSARSTRPMRSPWWVVPFAGLLCAEWALRRRHGLR